jgi:hypothetical protein
MMKDCDMANGETCKINPTASLQRKLSNNTFNGGLHPIIAARFLKGNFQFEPKYSIRNNLELIKKLDKLEIRNNNKLVSLHVTDMFGKIPKVELITLLGNNRYHGHPDGKKHKAIVREIVKLELLPIIV